MKSIACTEALRLLEQGWDDSLENTAFKTTVYHVATCPSCAAAVADWARADRLLAEFSAAVDRSVPRRSLTERVYRAVLREGMTVDEAADRRLLQEADLARFLSRMREDAGLRDRVSQCAGLEAIVDTLVALAAENGLYFAASTVHAALANTRAANDGELTDEQLEAVAGGASEQLLWFQQWVGNLNSAQRGK